MTLQDGGDHWSVVIKSEGEAWEFFQRALGGEFADKPLIPRFEGWPSQEIIFWIGDKHEVLTAPMMEALLDYQRGLYRSFLFLTADTTNLQRLSGELRARYEVEFRVGEGCTKLIPDFGGILDKVIEASVGKMTGTELTVTILGIALIWGGVVAWRAWLKHKSEVAANEASNAKTRDFLRNQRFASEAETQRLEIVTRALVQATGSYALVEASTEAKDGIIRAASRVDATEVGGVAITPEVAQRMSRRSRSEPEHSVLEGAFEVLRNDSAPNMRFRVKLRHVESGREFFAYIRDALLAGDDREIISDAEWAQTPFWGRVEIRTTRGEIIDATVVQALRRVA
jgi:hypothetical protein